MTPVAMTPVAMTRPVAMTTRQNRKRRAEDGVEEQTATPVASEDLQDVRIVLRNVSQEIDAQVDGQSAMKFDLIIDEEAVVEALIIKELPTSGRRVADIATRLGYRPGSEKFTLAAQRLPDDPPLTIVLPDKAPRHMSMAERTPLLTAMIEHCAERWRDLGRPARIDWLARQLLHNHQQSNLARKPSVECRAKQAELQQKLRVKGFSSEAGNGKRSDAAHKQLIEHHEELSVTKGLTGKAASPSQMQEARVRRPCRTRMDSTTKDELWVRLRAVVERLHENVRPQPGADMLEILSTIPAASEGSVVEGRTRASATSMDALLVKLAVELNAPVLALHGDVPTGEPSLLAGAMCVRVAWGTGDVCTPEQVRQDALRVVETAKSTLRDRNGKLHFDQNGKLKGKAFFGPAQLTSNQTVIIFSTQGNRSPDPNTDRTDGLLRELEKCGPSNQQLAAALRTGRDSIACGSRILRAEFLIYMSGDDDDSYSEGTWHQDGEQPGVAFRIAISLSPGGGLEISPSSRGHDATTLMRDVLQGHLMHYDFYTEDRTPFHHRGSPRKGDGLVLVLTFRDCTIAEAVGLLKKMGFSITAV